MIPYCFNILVSKQSNCKETSQYWKQFQKMFQFLYFHSSTISVRISIIIAAPMEKAFNFQQGQFFKFPMSSQGLQSFTTIGLMKQTYLQLFHKIYGNSNNIKWTFYFIRTKNWKQCNIKYKQKFIQIWKMKCNICTNTIKYARKEGFNEFFLLDINYYHLHTMDANKYIQYLKHNTKFTAILRYIDSQSNINSSLINFRNQEAILQCISNLPNSLNKATKFWIIQKYFGLSEQYFDELIRKLSKKYEISFQQLIQKLQKKNYQFRYLPSHLLCKSFEDHNHNNQNLRPQQIKDEQNPNLPNILIIVSPQMKQQYRKFGQLVGFDLTFSVVSQRTKNNGEYMIGVFASSNHSKKIVVFGLVVTNSQTVFAYSYIFKSFFQIMQSVPQVIITDQEKAMYYSLKELKQQGIFTGDHLLDMFHILRKFRKCSSESQTFQLFRQLIHSKNRLSYRKTFQKLVKQVVNDKELNLLRNFDLHSERYCYSQINPKFVGIGVSNSVNQFFHSLIKNDIPHATKMIKSVQIVLELISKRISFSNIPVFTKHPYEVIFNVPFMRPLTTALSDRVFGYVLKQTSCSPQLRILSIRQENEKQLSKVNHIKISSQNLLNRNHFYIQSVDGLFLVQKQYFKYQSKENQRNYKWICSCQLEGRAGFPCCHLAKILINDNMSLFENIHKRWIIDPQFLQKNYEVDYCNLKLRRQYQRKLYGEKDYQIAHKNINGYKLNIPYDKDIKQRRKRKGQQHQSSQNFLRNKNERETTQNETNHNTDEGDDTTINSFQGQDTNNEQSMICEEVKIQQQITPNVIVNQIQIDTTPPEQKEIQFIKKKTSRMNIRNQKKAESAQRFFRTNLQKQRNIK